MFTYTEKFGEEPIENWLTNRIKHIAQRDYGMEVDVTIKQDNNQLEQS